MAEEFSIGEALDAYDRIAREQREAERAEPLPNPMAEYEAILRTGAHPPQECGDPGGCPDHQDMYFGYLGYHERGAQEAEEQGLATGQDIVWVRDVDLNYDTRLALSRMHAQGLLVSYPKPRGIDKMVWRPMPRYFAEQYDRPHYDEPVREGA